MDARRRARGAPRRRRQPVRPLGRERARRAPRADRIARRHDAQRGPLRRGPGRARRDRRRAPAARRRPRARAARSSSWPGRGRSRASAPDASGAARRRGTSPAPTSTGCATATGRAWPRRCAAPGSTRTGSRRRASTPTACTRSSSCTSSRAPCSRRRASRSASSRRSPRRTTCALTLGGSATHAGATPMHLRRDALVGAAEAIAALERLARASPSGTTVGTVGVLRVRPGAINVVPGEVELDVDIRDADLAAREQVVEGLLAAVREIAARRGLTLAVDPIVEDIPVHARSGVAAAARPRRASRAAVPAHDERRLSRRDGDGRARADRDDLRAERRRHQPQSRRAHRPRRPRARRAVLAGTLARLAA